MLTQCPVLQANAMNMIKSKEIALGEVEERKVGDQFEYLAKIYRSDGRKVEINTPFFHLKKLAFENFQQNIKFVQVPMTKWLREQVQEIERGVESQVKLPDDMEHLGVIMKRMFCGGDTANIVTSKWIKFIPCDDNGNVIAEDVDTEMIEDTEFSFRIEFSHVYMGTHKNGQTVSCAVRVMGIRYKKDVVTENESPMIDESEVEDRQKPEIKLTAEEKVKLVKSKTKVKRLNTAK